MALITLKRRVETLESDMVTKGVTNGNSHDHTSGKGSAITEAAITLSDNAVLDASTARHGLCPKLPVDPDKFLAGDGQHPHNNGLLGRWVCPGHQSSLVAPQSGFEGGGYVTNTIFNDWFWPAPSTASTDKVLKWYTGGSWKRGRLKRWTGSAWVSARVKRWTGAEWEEVGQ